MSNHHIETTAQPPKRLKSYVIGFVLSIALTLIAFALVNKHSLSSQHLFIAVAVLALLLLLVQTVCYLRLKTGSEDDNWNLITYLFTIFVVIIVVAGSLWIMWNLNYNMAS